jgi:ElaB/YqjD/DUF883 family membrane-anchored ribosome-binding protein
METRAKELTGQAKNIAREAQETAKEAAGQIAEKAREFGATAKEAAQSAYGTAQEKVKAGAQATDQAIRANPYTALGIAFGCGVLLGFLIKRK